MPELFFIRLGSLLLTATIFATFFFQLDSSPTGAQSRFGFFALAISTIYYSSTDSLPALLQHLRILLRDTAHNSYRISSYVISSSLLSLPSFFILSLAFASVTFTGVGLAGNGSSEGFLFYFSVILASFWAGTGFVSFLAALIFQGILAYLAAVAMIGYFLLFSGFFVSRNRLPEYWSWFHYVSLVKYSYEGVLGSEFGGEGKCFVRGVQVFDTMPLREMPVEMKERALAAVGEALGVVMSPETCLMSGRDILKQNGVTQLGKWWCLAVIVAWGFLFRGLFYLAILLRARKKRR